jgi:hypothetical protein
MLILNSDPDPPFSQSLRSGSGKSFRSGFARIILAKPKYFCCTVPVLAIHSILAAVEAGHPVVEDPCEGECERGGSGQQLARQAQAHCLLLSGHLDGRGTDGPLIAAHCCRLKLCE